MFTANPYTMNVLSVFVDKVKITISLSRRFIAFDPINAISY